MICVRSDLLGLTDDKGGGDGKMRAVQVTQAGGALERVEREMPEPAQGEVRIRVEACGVCHSDSLTVEGQP